MSTLILDSMGADVAWIRLNDPTRLNAMTEVMAGEFGQVIAQLRGQPLRAVVISGEGRAFSAGGDLDMLDIKRRQDWETNRVGMLGFYRSFLDLLSLEVPLVSAVHGWAVGAGCCLAAACDIRLADPDAKFRVPFLQMGLFPGMGTTYWMPRRLGPWAAEFLLTGSTLGASEAHQRGLVTALAAPGAVLDLAAAQVQRILANGAEATRDLLGVLRGDPADLQAALEREADLQSQSYNREEFAEGLARARQARR